MLINEENFRTTSCVDMLFFSVVFLIMFNVHVRLGYSVAVRLIIADHSLHYFMFFSYVFFSLHLFCNFQQPTQPKWIYHNFFHARALTWV